MIPFSPLHRQYLTTLGLGVLLALGGWLLWHAALFLWNMYSWFLTFVSGHLSPLRWDRPLLLFWQSMGWASFLIPTSIPLVGLWNLLQWWRHGGPWVPPAQPRRRNPYQVWSRAEHADLQRVLDAHRPR